MKAPHCPDDGDPRCCYPHCLCPRLPAVAAEPVAWRHKTAMTVYNVTDTVNIADPKWGIDLSLFDPLYASPPVRGDRDKFYAALSGRLANDMIDTVWQAVQESGVCVGVQSGAGERDTLPLKELLNERDAFIVRKGLWSEFTDSLRQAPHSPETKP